MLPQDILCLVMSRCDRDLRQELMMRRSLMRRSQAPPWLQKTCFLKSFLGIYYDNFYNGFTTILRPYYPYKGLIKTVVFKSFLGIYYDNVYDDFATILRPDFPYKSLIFRIKDLFSLLRSLFFLCFS